MVKNARNIFFIKRLTIASSSKSFNHVSIACLSFPVKSKPSVSRPGVRLSQFLENKNKTNNEESKIYLHL
jgi:hypothetical protein